MTVSFALNGWSPALFAGMGADSFMARALNPPDPTACWDVASFRPNICTASNDDSGGGDSVDRPRLIPRIFAQPIRVPGKVELFALLELGHGSGHSYGIKKRIEERTGGAIKFSSASVNNTLHTFQKMGWIEFVEKVQIHKGKPERINYELTDLGREYLRQVRQVLAVMLI